MREDPLRDVSAKGDFSKALGDRQHVLIPPAAHTYQSDVQTVHRLEEMSSSTSKTSRAAVTSWQRCIPTELADRQSEAKLVTLLRCSAGLDSARSQFFHLVHLRLGSTVSFESLFSKMAFTIK
jgi:transcriptional regulator of acetoin/glycerol metabolism